MIWILYFLTLCNLLPWFSNFCCASMVIETLKRRAKDMLPNVDISRCVEGYNNEKLNLKCILSYAIRDIKGMAVEEAESALVNCHRGPPAPRDAWLLRCIADTLVSEGGYQIPAYILTSPHSFHRRQRITQHLKRSKFQHVYFRDDFPPGRIPKVVKDKYFIETLPAHVNGSSPQETQKCAVALFMATRNMNKATKDCKEKGMFLSEKEKSIGLKHIKFHESILDCARENRQATSFFPIDQSNSSVPTAYTFRNRSEALVSPDGKVGRSGMCLSPGTSNTTRYALVLEDDELLSVTLLRELVVLILTSPEEAGLFMLDDMYYANYGVHHDILYSDFGRAQSPYSNSFEKWQSRAIGSYLVSEATLERMFAGGNWVPQRRPVDHQMTLSIQAEKIRTFWAYPPLTCHGSYRFTDGNPNVNTSCHGCCFTFYNLTTMRPRLVSMDLYDESGVIWNKFKTSNSSSNIL